MSSDVDHPRITVTPDGPYRVAGDVEIRGTDGTVLHRGPCALCRCGGSASKPFCDGTHRGNGFDGTEAADHGPAATRRDAYPVDGITVYDDRARCAHWGECTDRLPQVFRSAAEPFVDPGGAPPQEITAVVARCPSGALSYAVGDDPDPVEDRQPASVTPLVDGPYRVRGAVPVVGSDGRGYEPRERATLCRCGHSAAKPFCDGSHWYAGFRDPADERLDPVQGTAAAPPPAPG